MLRAGALVVALLCSGVAAAGKPAPAPSPSARAGAADEEQARQHYKAGITAYDFGEYERAIVEFKAAYAISNAPLLLFNIAQALRLSRHYDEALHFYQTYLRLNPRAKNRKDVNQFVSEMEQEVRLHPAPTAAPSPATAATPPVAPNPPPPTADDRAAVAASPPAPSAAPVASAAPLLVDSRVEVSPRPLYKRWWFWTAIGVVAVGAAAAVWVTAGNREVLPSGSYGTLDARH